MTEKLGVNEKEPAFGQKTPTTTTTLSYHNVIHSGLFAQCGVVYNFRGLVQGQGQRLKIQVQGQRLKIQGQELLTRSSMILEEEDKEFPRRQQH